MAWLLYPYVSRKWAWLDYEHAKIWCKDSLRVFSFFVAQPKEKTAARPKTLAELRMQLKLEREAESQSHPRGGGESWTGAGPAAKSHLTELTRLMEGARTEAGKNFSQLLQKLDNIKQASVFVVACCWSEWMYTTVCAGYLWCSSHWCFKIFVLFPISFFGPRFQAGVALRTYGLSLSNFATHTR